RVVHVEREARGPGRELEQRRAQLLGAGLAADPGPAPGEGRPVLLGVEVRVEDVALAHAASASSRSTRARVRSITLRVTGPGSKLPTRSISVTGSTSKEVPALKVSSAPRRSSSWIVRSVTSFSSITRRRVIESRI